MGDKSQAFADAHGCPGCPHPASGPAISGSPNVNINSRAALRVADSGVHAACCGTNSWTATTGARTVFINGKSAHRLGDQTQHCGGLGHLSEGSTNVFIGDSSSVGGQESEQSESMFDEHFVLIDDRTGRPVQNRNYRMESDNGLSASGRTSDTGKTEILSGQRPHKVVVYIELQDKIVIE